MPTLFNGIDIEACQTLHILNGDLFPVFDDSKRQHEQQSAAANNRFSAKSGVRALLNVLPFTTTTNGEGGDKVIVIASSSSSSQPRVWDYIIHFASAIELWRQLLLL